MEARIKSYSFFAFFTAALLFGLSYFAVSQVEAQRCDPSDPFDFQCAEDHDNDGFVDACIAAEEKQQNFFIPFKISTSGDYPDVGRHADTVEVTQSNPVSEGYLNITHKFTNIPDDFQNAELRIHFTDLDLQGDITRKNNWTHRLDESYALYDPSGNLIVLLDESYPDDDDFWWQTSLNDSIFTGDSLTLRATLFAQVSMTGNADKLRSVNTIESIENISICGEIPVGGDDPEPPDEPPEPPDEPPDGDPPIVGDPPFIDVDRAIIRDGGEVEVSWDPNGNTNCVLSSNLGSLVVTQPGSTIVSPQFTSIFTIICDGGEDQEDFVTVRVLPQIEET